MNVAIQRSGCEVRRLKHKRSFTLIELLVVVAIILILAGLTIRVMSMVNRKTGQVATMRILEQVKNALAAYYTTYGSYPPVNSVYYEYESTPMASLPALPSDPHYTTGLVYYIYSISSWPYHNPDAEVVQWQHYLEGIGSGGGPTYSNQIGGAFWVSWTNSSHTINDAWSRELKYQHSADYQSFKLWSLGPDGADNAGGGDDIGVTSED